MQGDPWEKAVQGAQRVQRKEVMFTRHGGGWETLPRRGLELKAALLFWMTNLRFRNEDDTCKASYAIQTAVALKLFYNSSGFCNEFKDKLVLWGCIRP